MLLTSAKGAECNNQDPGVQTIRLDMSTDYVHNSINDDFVKSHWLLDAKINIAKF